MDRPPEEYIESLYRYTTNHSQGRARYAPFLAVFHPDEILDLISLIKQHSNPEFKKAVGITLKWLRGALKQVYHDMEKGTYKSPRRSPPLRQKQKQQTRSQPPPPPQRPKPLIDEHDPDAKLLNDFARMSDNKKLTYLKTNMDLSKTNCLLYARLLDNYMTKVGNRYLRFAQTFDYKDIRTLLLRVHPDKCHDHQYSIVGDWLKNAKTIASQLK